MALQLLSVAIGSYLSGAVVVLVSIITDYMGCDWLPQDLNYGRLDLFFLLLAGACSLCHSSASMPAARFSLHLSIIQPAPCVFSAIQGVARAVCGCLHYATFAFQWPLLAVLRKLSVISPTLTLGGQAD